MYANWSTTSIARRRAEPTYDKLWDDIRECIDEAHRDDSMKAIIRGASAFIVKDPVLAETLHKFRSSGKKLFLLTNSAWDYTSRVMSYLLDGELDRRIRRGATTSTSSSSAPASRRSSPTSSRSSRSTPRARRSCVADGRPADAPFARGRIYPGGNIRDFEERARASGDHVLYIGDHIYGDMLRSRKSSNWRTAMVLQELEREVSTYDRMRVPLARLDQLDNQLIHLDSEINERQNAMRTLQKLGAEAPLAGHLPAAKRQIKDAIEKLRADLRAATTQHRTVESEIDDAFNPHWGPLFREGYEVSKFGEQVEAYACVYTSRVSNFRFSSPMQYFRGPRDRMPHERV